MLAGPCHSDVMMTNIVQSQQVLLSRRIGEKSATLAAEFNSCTSEVVLKILLGMRNGQHG